MLLQECARFKRTRPWDQDLLAGGQDFEGSIDVVGGVELPWIGVFGLPVDKVHLGFKAG